MNVTEKALELLRTQIPSEELAASTVRFYSAQGCCGPSLQMGVFAQTEADDETFRMDNVAFAIAADTIETLREVTLDASENGFELRGYQPVACC
jgi:Fe-S cluster assembly iron-binding protein IscA